MEIKKPPASQPTARALDLVLNTITRLITHGGKRYVESRLGYLVEVYTEALMCDYTPSGFVEWLVHPTGGNAIGKDGDPWANFPHTERGREEFDYRGLLFRHGKPGENPTQTFCRKFSEVLVEYEIDARIEAHGKKMLFIRL